MQIAQTYYMGRNKKDSPPPRNRIAIIRQSKNPPMSQLDLALLIGSSEETVRRYENGDRDIDTGKLFKIAEALQCEPYELLADKEVILAAEAAYLAKQRTFLNAFENAPDHIKSAIKKLLFPDNTAKDVLESELKKRTG